MKRPPSLWDMDRHMIPWIPLCQRSGPALGRLSLMDHSDDRPRDVGFVLHDLIPGLGLDQAVSHMLSQMHKHRPDLCRMPSSRIGLFQLREIGNFSTLSLVVPRVTPRKTSEAERGWVCLFTRSMPKRAALPTTFGETPLASPSRVRISATVLPACCLLKAFLPFSKSLTAVAASCPAEDNNPTPGSCPEVRP